jgi:3-keto-disaccharide hydrolase
MKMRFSLRICLLSVAGILSLQPVPGFAADTEPALPKATIDGTGLGWKSLGEPDFVPVNGAKDTWSFQNGIIHCTGKPIGVMRTRKEYTNFELVAQWQHLQAGGNSGIFVWAPPAALEGLKPGKLPQTGIEVQILDHGFTAQYEKRTGKKAEWFTTNGDIFPVANSKMKPFPPVAPIGMRAFPRKNLSKGVGEWNHYYVRAINGEIRLWVNGEEVSGGSDCQPHAGYLCLESEGAPVEFKNLRIRELP